MMRCFPLACLLLFAACSAPKTARNSTDFWLNYYRDGLTPGNRPLAAGPTWTLEQARDGHFLRKEYFYDTRTKTAEQSFLDPNGKTPDGISATWTDAGKLAETGQFQKGRRTGRWQRFNWKTGLPTAEGNYADDRQTGNWTYFNAEGKPNYTCQYRDGERDGPARCLAPNGSVLALQQWQAGKILLEKTGCDTAQHLETPPQFPCSSKFLSDEKCAQASLLDFLNRNLDYPKAARKREISGQAIVSFVVERDGAVKEIEVLRGLCSAIRDECLRVVNAMPKWQPGRRDGQAVRVRYTLPIGFRVE